MTVVVAAATGQYNDACPSRDGRAAIGMPASGWSHNASTDIAMLQKQRLPFVTGCIAGMLSLLEGFVNLARSCQPYYMHRLAWSLCEV